MHSIRAIIQPHMIGKVMRALRELPHFPGCTVIDAHGQGRGRGVGGVYEATEDDIEYNRKVELEVVCADDLVSAVSDAIGEAARTGHRGDGLILVTELRSVIRIRTGEDQEKAV